ncbi:uncharacterized protein DNG_10086 [Cephalotrichum gorgonifer]|uniref:Protein kinase domain-containing protein n=1 Tax=Cephalotrichum gorgonifer TaxID=2041049 RepID=A0AAE8N8Z8_9PEZI|nr:uncharacterized protein DNG_10086 [Cephalotrichum gorgonifer]
MPPQEALDAETGNLTRRQDFENARDRFRSCRRKHERTAVGGQTFVLVKPLTDELRASGVLDEVRHRANGIISAQGTPMIKVDKLPGYLRIFYILVEIGHPQSFRAFLDYNLNDDKLPLDEMSLNQLLSAHEKTDATFSQRFLEEQVAWCPINFYPGMSLVQGNRISPFYHQRPIWPKRDNHRNLSNNARLFEVHVPAELLCDDICGQLDDDEACLLHSLESRDKKASISGTNVGKQFPSTQKETFETERYAFEEMRNQAGLIRYIASYQTSIDEHETHYNILLEYSEIDLHEVMTTEAPPVIPNDIEFFWYAMLEICQSLAAIRTIDIEGSQFHVWHCDVKPENILRTGGRFKLADLGEARIQMSNGDEKQPEAVITGGTRTYASPEKAAYLDGRVSQAPKIHQNSDVWSLGAVLSIAVTYVVLGTQGVLKYDRVRRYGTERAAKAAGMNKRGDGFHDGLNVLDEVRDWHQFLRSSTRRHDNFTPAILDLIDKHMLVDSRERYDSAATAHHLEKILQETTSGVGSGNFCVPPSIQTMLRDIENDAESFREQSLTSSATGMQTIHAGNSNVDITEEASRSKISLLRQEIQPTAPQGGLRRRVSLQPPPPPASTSSITRSAPRQTLSIDPPAGATPPRKRSAYEEFYEPYTVFNLREDLDELDRQTPGRRLTSKFLQSMRLPKKTDSSVKGRWNANEDLLDKAFGGRDIIFLIDNGSTMAVHWQEATELLVTLVRRVHGYDDDGIELYFTGQEQATSAVPLKGQRAEKFLNAMKEAKPGGGNKLSVTADTDLVPKLSSINTAYLNERKPKTIIVFTDGCWMGMRNEYAVDLLVTSNVMQLRTMHPNSAIGDERSKIEEIRPVTIQFVQFGKHPQGAERLRRLDDDLAKQGYEDMIDCEPSNGDVYKMFLGSILRDMDRKANVANFIPSPLTRSPSGMDFSEKDMDQGGDDENLSPELEFDIFYTTDALGVVDRRSGIEPMESGSSPGVPYSPATQSPRWSVRGSLRGKSSLV